MANFLLYFISLLLVIRITNGDIFIGAGLVGIGAVIGVAIHYVMNLKGNVEHCNPDWVSLNETKLFYDLNRRLYGQHLASDIIFKAIKGHLDNKTPEKALVLSLNGMTGSGKNYASQIIVESIYEKGLSSQYVKLIIGSHDFKHGNELEGEKMKLKNWITEIVSKCPRSLFIFDEVEKISPKLIDVLKPFLSHYPKVYGVDYRKTIFIFIGNTGADLINEEIISNRQKGKRREDITIEQMDKILSKDALNKVGGFLHSTLLDHQLVDYFVPFLPLEKHHLLKCIEDDLREKNVRRITLNLVENVLNELLFFPGDTQWFSESGCKKVSSKVDQYIE